MREDGFFRVQSELVSTAISKEFSLPQPTTSLPSTSQHLPQTTCASFLINRLLNDREDGNQHPPFSPEFELDNWNDDETDNTDRDDDDYDDDDDDDDDDNDDITDYVDLCSKRAIQASDIL
jgi:hypothetical protein